MEAMRIECIAIGTELLTTRRLDTNSVWIAERLAELGLGLSFKTAVGDSRDDLAQVFRTALDRSDLILTTGGLGPTFDDFTKELFAEILGVPLVEDSQSRADILAFYEARKRVPAQANFKQALVPAGAEVLRNPVGTAPGVYWQDPPGHPGRRILMFPGVPREMKRMWEDHAHPRLRELAGRPVHTLRMVVAGVPESTLDERIRAVREAHGTLEWTILASLTQVELLARGEDAAALAQARADLEPVLGADLACVGDGNLEEAVLELLRGRGETLALAESVTGGLIASRLTAVPGASDILVGGATVYTATAKTTLLGLDPGVLAAEGTVSEATSRRLAEAARARLGAAWGLAVTGNAGPGVEGSAPLGRVFLSVAGPGGTAAGELNVPGDRGEVQLRAAGAALDLLRRAVAAPGR